MSAYMIVQMNVLDQERWSQYGQAVVPLIKRFDGRLMALNNVEVLEGEHDGRGIAIFEFQSIEDIHAFWNSPEYRPVKALREGAAMVDAWAVPAA